MRHRSYLNPCTLRLIYNALLHCSRFHSVPTKQSWFYSFVETIGARLFFSMCYVVYENPCLDIALLDKGTTPPGKSFDQFPNFLIVDQFNVRSFPS